MIVVVADTTPINYLIQIGAICTLPRLFEEIVIPKAVEVELLHASSPFAVREWVSSLPNWARVRSALHVAPLNLDPGETEAIALAKELNAFAVLLDDGDARQTAKREGLRVTGTIGILERAAEEGFLNLSSAFEKLRATTFYAAPGLLRAVLDRHEDFKRSH
jgi:predicted nucleic acid-binding protein